MVYRIKRLVNRREVNDICLVQIFLKNSSKFDCFSQMCERVLFTIPLHFLVWFDPFHGTIFSDVITRGEEKERKREEAEKNSSIRISVRLNLIFTCANAFGVCDL